jgi:hypothetical protein
MLKIIRFNPVEISDVLFHVLDYLDLLGMEVEPPFFGRGINLLPFGGWQDSQGHGKAHHLFLPD